MKIDNIKSNKGISMIDIGVSIVVLMMFVGIIGTLYYNIVKNNNMIYMNAVATDYAVKIAENIDKIPYNEVTEELNNTVKTKYNIEEPYKVTIEVKNYNELDSSKQDVIKTVTIKIEYKFLNDAISYQVKKLKIKEI